LLKTVNQTYAIEASEVKLIKVLGGGSFGNVYLANVREQTVAAKVFHHQEMTAEAYDDFVNEVEILRFVWRCIFLLLKT
jgi:serine/threonine protein kinase